MPFPLFGIDAFTDEPFRGNPAAVCLLEAPADEDWMQHVAAEMNLSETAYVHPQDGAYGLRWFTPTAEVQLCGHATLASAHVLWATSRVPSTDAITFQTRWKGALTASVRDDGIAIDFPAAPSTPCEAPRGLSAALGAEIAACAVNDLHHVVELADDSTVRALDPDFEALRQVEVEAVAVTARAADGAADFVSRYFAPRHGIEEDPVTGSAHTSLGPYWSAKLDKRALLGHQVSARGGWVRVEVGDERVVLIGDAVTVWSGELA